MINPTKNDIGRKVIYTKQHNTRPEKGIITSFNKHFIFVRFRGSTSEACLRRDLIWDDAPQNGGKNAIP